MVDAPAELVDAQGRRDIYTVFVQSFGDLRILVTYLAATTFLAMHLSHGVQSMFKTLGLAKGRFRAPIEAIGPIVGVFLWIGYVAPPLACYMHVITTDGPVAAHAGDHHGGAKGEADHDHDTHEEAH